MRTFLIVLLLYLLSLLKLKAGENETLRLHSEKTPCNSENNNVGKLLLLNTSDEFYFYGSISNVLPDTNIVIIMSVANSMTSIKEKIDTDKIIRTYKLNSWDNFTKMRIFNSYPADLIVSNISEKEKKLI